MKRIFIPLIVVMLSSLPAVVSAANTVSYLPEVEVSAPSCEQVGRKVELKMLVDLSRLDISTQHTLALTPILVSKDGTRSAEFPPVVIDGKTRHKVYLRSRKFESVATPPLHDDGAACVIIRRKNGSEQSYDYSAEIPYERWMLDGHIEMREDIHGCANCRQGIPGSEVTLAHVLPEFVANYSIEALPLASPETEEVRKIRTESREAYLQFRLDKYDILPKYKNNRAELDTIFNSIALVKNNPDLTIKGISITGYASPEGTVAHNEKLSENRARSLARYIAEHEDYPLDMLSVHWCGEDWEGLRRELDNFPGLYKREEVIEIIENCSGNRDACEDRLSKIDPSDVYTRLTNEVYPRLRRNVYRITYEVRNYNLEESRTMINVRPDLMSLAEISKVAASYPKHSEEYSTAMEAAARYYSDTPSVLNCIALDAIELEQYDRAAKLLESSEVTNQNAVLLNTLGIAYARMGQYHNAADAFTRASAAGSAAAALNLEQVNGVINQL